MASRVEIFLKLGLENSLVLPVLQYGLICIGPLNFDLNTMERFQCKAVKWTAGRNEMYVNQLRLLKNLPHPMYIQLLSLLILSKKMIENNKHVEFPKMNQTADKRRNSFYCQKQNCRKPEVCLQKLKIANRIDRSGLGFLPFVIGRSQGTFSSNKK